MEISIAQSRTRFRHAPELDCFQIGDDGPSSPRAGVGAITGD
jgi:hypothetical protein